jgi:hypothetical protein
MQGLVALVPGMGDVLGHAVEQARIGAVLDGVNLIELAVENDTNSNVVLARLSP